ncbi:hypothetical protein ABPG75_004077 [Micractinium tetrahymenae]
MVLPPAVLLVKGIGWAQGLAFVVLSNRRAGSLRSAVVSDSSTGSPGALLAYRLVMLCWALFIGLRQLLQRGPHVFVFFTVWNWWLLTLFFLCGSAASLRAWARRRRGSSAGSGGSGAPPPEQQRQRQHVQRRGQHKQQLHASEDPPADWLDRAVIAIFSAEMPASFALDALTWLVLVPMENAAADATSRAFWHEVHHSFESYNAAVTLDALTWLVLVPMVEASETDPARRAFWKGVFLTFESYNMTLAIDFLTWAVLVPMILAEYTEPRLQFFEATIFCFESYNQHAFNAVMMFGEALLNRVPVTFYESGWLALWSSLFGVWSAVFYHRTGRAIYPFLGEHVSKSYSWASYLGIFGTLWVAYLLFMGLARLKDWALSAATASAGPAIAGAPASPAALAPPGGGMHARMQDLVDSHVPLLGTDKLKMG